MSVDVTLAPMQDEIADSIFADDNIVGSWKEGALAETATEQQETQESPPSGAERLADLSTDRSEGRPEQLTEDQTRDLARKVAQPRRILRERETTG